MAVDGGCQLTHRSARVVDDEDRQTGGRSTLGAGRVGEDGDGTESGRLGHEVGAVQTRAGQGGVHVTGAHRAGVMGDARDLRVASRLLGAQLIGQFSEMCGGDVNRSRRPRICHRNALLGGLGLISGWHGGERTGRTPPGRSEGGGGSCAEERFPGSGVIVVTSGSWSVVRGG